MPPGVDRSQRSAQGPDCSGLWFKIIEEVGMRGGKGRTAGSISWSFLSHASYDGLGGFVHLLRRDHGAGQVEVSSNQKHLHLSPNRLPLSPN
jgi:hypothetical protein